LRIPFLRLFLLGLLIIAPGSLMFVRHTFAHHAFMRGVFGGAPSVEAQSASAPRSDGKTTPLLIYKAEGVTTGCAPLIIFSHGAGGSEKGYSYLAEAMAKNGYTVIAMGHQESGMSALGKDMLEDGIRPGVRALVVDPQAEEARLLDLDATLKYADAQCKAPFRVLMGHSMGAITTMLEAGAVNIVNVPLPPAGQNRFDAYVALSAEGPGVVFSDHAWENIHKPVLILTGTRDQAIKGGPESRQVAWHELPGDPKGRCQWLGVIDDATHMNFAGIGLGHRLVEPKVVSTITSFLAGVRQGSCTLPAAESGMTLQAK